MTDIAGTCLSRSRWRSRCWCTTHASTVFQEALSVLQHANMCLASRSSSSSRAQGDAIQYTSLLARLSDNGPLMRLTPVAVRPHRHRHAGVFWCNFRACPSFETTTCTRRLNAPVSASPEPKTQSSTAAKHRSRLHRNMSAMDNCAASMCTATCTVTGMMHLFSFARGRSADRENTPALAVAA
ncbi:hypothetical protein T440DRAFT_101326 [Plenodomus tracheiphilus IPT5]|uniref:Uncharacterized protein n=1 Tax=Plenodomus tracheiphilus IPT5 TaxID=1408161 RepID=A0A6A7BPQ4_9PLEO|nr:hypothetical protein T440DRAFT_101326 [Plenodomus tracheiphilus IPT5]